MKLKTMLKNTNNKKLYHYFVKALKCNIAKYYPHILNVFGCSPLTATLRITQRCTAKCLSCNHWKVATNNELSTDEWKKIIFDLKNKGISFIRFTGGDIFLRKDLFELISFAEQNKLSVRMAINGYTITDEIAKKLMNTKISMLFLSIDDLSENFNEIRGAKNATKSVFNTLELLKKYNNNIAKLGIATTLMKNNINKIRSVIDFAIENNLFVNIIPIHFTHYFTDTKFSKEQYDLDHEDKKHLVDTINWLGEKHIQHPDKFPKHTHLKWIYCYFQNYKLKEYPCFKPLLSICIEPNGDIKPCCSMASIGNILKTPLSDLVISGEHINIAKKGIKKECPGCSCGYSISLNANINTYVKEVVAIKRNFKKSKKYRRKSLAVY
jgi:MoaA/NifB/PqqE/SkfB family radical SAM enzyme